MKRTVTGIVLLAMMLAPTACFADPNKEPSFGQSASLAIMSAVVGCISGIVSAMVGILIERRKLTETLALQRASKAQEIVDTMEPELAKLERTLRTQLEAKKQEMEAGLDVKIEELKAQNTLKEETEQEQAIIAWRLRYLGPLYSAMREAKDRMDLIVSKIEVPKDSEEMQNWFRYVKEVGTWKGAGQEQKIGFYFWCNGVGHFAMSSLYDTIVYFAYARQLVTQAPYVVTRTIFFSELQDDILQISAALGGPYNIWKEAQQTLGAIAWRNTGPVDYKEFCVSLTNETEAPWFLRLIDFYSDVHLKHEDCLKIRAALQTMEDRIKKASVDPTILQTKAYANETRPLGGPVR